MHISNQSVPPRTTTVTNTSNARMQQERSLRTLCKVVRPIPQDTIEVTTTPWIIVTRNDLVRFRGKSRAHARVLAGSVDLLPESLLGQGPAHDSSALSHAPTTPTGMGLHRCH